jgi:ppGpp synthetase/RelA/SpoT-type nucleotidyltranferase
VHPLREIEDQIAGRVIVFFRGDLPIVRARLGGTFSEVKWTHRQPPRDAEFGYESDHLICMLPPQAKTDVWEGQEDLPSTFELQLRTVFMHAYSEPQHDLAYKQASDLPSEVRREIAWVAASAWGADQAYDRIMQWHAGESADKA